MFHPVYFSVSITRFHSADDSLEGDKFSPPFDFLFEASILSFSFFTIGINLIPLDEIMNLVTFLEWGIPLDFITYKLRLRSSFTSTSWTMIQVSTIDEMPSSLGFRAIDPTVIAAVNITVICSVFK